MPEPTDLTLDQYIQRLHEEVDDFAKNWRAQHAVDADHWPMEMAEADWDDQFISETM